MALPKLNNDQRGLLEKFKDHDGDRSPVTFDGLGVALEAAVEAQQIFTLIGPSGVGKSEAVKTIHKLRTGNDGVAVSHVDWREGVSGYHILNLTGKNPDSVAGFLMPDPENESGYTIAPNQWPLADVVGDAEITLCIDEVDKLSTDVQNLLLTLHNPATDGYRYIGSHRLGKNVFIYFTANTKEFCPSSKELQDQLTSRCYVRDLHADVVAWAKGYALPNGFDSSPVYQWLTAYGADWFCPTPEGKGRTRSIPCPRTWSAACRTVKWTDSFEDAVLEKLWPLVGKEAAIACGSFISLAGGFSEKYDKLKAGLLDVSHLDTHDQYALITCALRKLPADYPDLESSFKGTENGSELDWFITALTKIDAEIREWSLNLASSLDIPYHFHPVGAELKNNSNQ
jgi:energy-coupling factor transporter ATP-binding protein EcfA2